LHELFPDLIDAVYDQEDYADKYGDYYERVGQVDLPPLGLKELGVQVFQPLPQYVEDDAVEDEEDAEYEGVEDVLHLKVGLPPWQVLPVI